MIEIIKIGVPSEGYLVVSHGDGTDFFTSATKFIGWPYSGLTEETFDWDKSNFFDDAAWSSSANGWADTATPIGYTKTEYLNSTLFNNLRRAELQRTSDDGVLAEYLPLATINNSATRVHRIGYYQGIFSSSWCRPGLTCWSFDDCTSGSNQDNDDDGYVWMNGSIADDNLGRMPERNPLSRGTLSQREAFTARIISNQDGTDILEPSGSFVINVPADHPTPKNPCYRQSSPGIRGLGGSAWAGADLLLCTDTSGGLQTSMDLDVVLRTDVDEHNDWIGVIYQLFNGAGVQV